MRGRENAGKSGRQANHPLAIVKLD
jgi:hypothetical protein